MKGVPLQLKVGSICGENLKTLSLFVETLTGTLKQRLVFSRFIVSSSLFSINEFKEWVFRIEIAL